MRAMQKRVGFLSACMLMTLPTVVGSRSVNPKQRLLLEHARPIVRVRLQEDHRGDSWRWLSDKDLLLLTTDPVPGTAARWRGRAVRLHVTNGKRTPLVGLEALWKREQTEPVQTPNYFEWSPDYKWLVWVKGVKDHVVTFGAAHLDGTHYRTWKEESQSDRFFLDDSHVVHRYLMGSDHLTIRDLQDAKRDHTYPETAPAARHALARQVALHPLFIDTETTEDDRPGHFTLRTYRTQDTIRVMHYDCCNTNDPPDIVRSHTVTLPPGATVTRAEVAPGDTTIYYHLSIQEKLASPGRFQHNRASVGAQRKPRATEALWASRADGSGLHEVGRLPAHTVDPDLDQEELGEIAWLPGGRQISFVYRSTLYVVDAVSGR